MVGLCCDCRNAALLSLRSSVNQGLISHTYVTPRPPFTPPHSTKANSYNGCSYVTSYPDGNWYNEGEFAGHSAGTNQYIEIGFTTHSTEANQDNDGDSAAHSTKANWYNERGL